MCESEGTAELFKNAIEDLRLAIQSYCAKKGIKDDTNAWHINSIILCNGCIINVDDFIASTK